MKVLIFGAGIIGKIYASMLFKSGADVTLLARGDNYVNIKHDGITLKNILTHQDFTHQIPVIHEIKSDDTYDLIIVTVRLDQLKSTESQINTISSKAVLFMLNNIKNLDELQTRFPDKELLLGFPGVSGTIDSGVVEYVQIKQQKSTLGNLDGKTTEFAQKIKTLFTQAGFETEIETNMKAWLKTHAVFITCVSASIIKESGNSQQLAANKKAVREMIDSIDEGFKALQRLEIQITPANLKTIFMTMPKWFSVLYWRKALHGTLGTSAMAPQAVKAKPEMRLLAKDVLELVNSSDCKTPTLEKLLGGLIK